MSPTMAVKKLCSIKKARVVWSNDPEGFFLRHARRFDNPHFVTKQMKTFNEIRWRFQVEGLCSSLSRRERKTIGKGRHALIVLKKSLPIKDKALFLAHEMGHAFIGSRPDDETLSYGDTSDPHPKETRDASTNATRSKTRTPKLLHAPTYYETATGWQMAQNDRI